MSFNELLSNVTRLGYGNVQADDAVASEGILLAALGLRMVELTAEPWRAVAQPSQHPRASVIARVEAASSDILTSLLHRRIQLDGPLALSLLRLCDGTRDRQALSEELAQLDSAAKPESIGILLGALTRLGVIEA
jgi:hypothetical protein